jgi:hypothetical protein
LVKAKISVKVQPDVTRRRRPLDAPYEIKPCESIYVTGRDISAVLQTGERM